MKFSLYSIDPKSGEKSVTITLLWIGVIVASIKLLLSGMSIYGHAFSEFTGMDFAAVVGSLGAIYGYRKHDEKDCNIDFEHKEGE